MENLPQLLFALAKRVLDSLSLRDVPDDRDDEGGVALGVAAKAAAEMNIDNRLFYSAGAAAMSLGFLEADMIVGLPLSISAKNIFFDRP